LEFKSERAKHRRVRIILQILVLFSKENNNNFGSLKLAGVAQLVAHYYYSMLSESLSLFHFLTLISRNINEKAQEADSREMSPL
jgi:hypothetical protein